MFDNTDRPRVLILADGDNISGKTVPVLFTIGSRLGEIVGFNVYANSIGISKFDSFLDLGIHAVEAPHGRNSGDILLAIDAMEFALGDDADIFVMATSDGGLAALAHRLRAKGKEVHVAYETPIGYHLRSCSLPAEIHDMSSMGDVPVTAPLGTFDEQVHAMIGKISGPVYMASIEAICVNKLGFGIGKTGFSKWRTYFKSRPDLFKISDDNHRIMAVRVQRPAAHDLEPLPEAM